MLFYDLFSQPHLRWTLRYRIEDKSQVLVLIAGQIWIIKSPMDQDEKIGNSKFIGKVSAVTIAKNFDNTPKVTLFKLNLKQKFVTY